MRPSASRLSELRPRALPDRAAKDPSRYKQFQRGIDQLDQEGVVQVLRSHRRVNQAPVLAAVGPMQFEVAAHRLEHELRAPIHLETLPYTIARRTRREDIAAIEARRGTEVLEWGWRAAGAVHRSLAGPVGAARPFRGGS